MAKNTPAAGDGGTEGSVLKLALAAAPFGLKRIDWLKTPENRARLASWEARAKRTFDKLRLDKYVDAKIERLGGDDSISTEQDWAHQLKQFAQRRELLRGPFDAKTRKQRLEQIDRDLDALRQDAFGNV